MASLHFAIFLIPKFGEESKWKHIGKFRTKAINFLGYVFYIRIALESNQIMLLASTSEIYIFDDSSASSITSLVIAFLVFVFSIFLLIITLYYFNYHRRRYDEEKKSMFQEIYTGLKNTKWARVFTFALL